MYTKMNQTLAGTIHLPPVSFMQIFYSCLQILHNKSNYIENEEKIKSAVFRQGKEGIK